MFGFVLHLALNPQRGVLFRVWFSLVLGDWSLLSTLLFFQMPCEIALVSILKICLYLLCQGQLSVSPNIPIDKVVKSAYFGLN